MLGTLIDCIATIPFLIPIIFLSKKERNIFSNIILLIGFVIYIISVFSITGIPSILYLSFDFDINLIPILDIIASPMTSILNILLFIPLGIFLPMLWAEKYNNNISKVLLFGFCLSLVIEISQIFTFRLTDINDLITNTLGTLIGYLVYVKLLKNKIIFKNVSDEKINPVILISTIFIIMFVVSTFISSAIWNLIL